MANKTMDLIDRNELLPNNVFYVCNENPMASVDELLNRISNAKTVDAVPVVRCKDCKHWDEETGWCDKHSHFIDRDGVACHPWENSEWNMFDADYFCKDGERRSDG